MPRLLKAMVVLVSYGASALFVAVAWVSADACLWPDPFLECSMPRIAEHSQGGALTIKP